MVMRRMRSELITPATSKRAGFLCLLLLTALSGCAKPQAPVSNTRLYAIDQVGAATRCSVQPVSVRPGQNASTKMTLANSGGWCAVTLTKPGGGPFDAGLVVQSPLHGKIYIHTVGDGTRIDYTPAPYYHGIDRFAVKLLPGEGGLAVQVSVTPQ